MQGDLADLERKINKLRREIHDEKEFWREIQLRSNQKIEKRNAEISNLKSRLGKMVETTEEYLSVGDRKILTVAVEEYKKELCKQ